jgi:hypothetical protein
MTIYVTANNVSTTLAAASSSSSTTFTLASNANLPTLSAGQVMPLTLNDAATGQTYEIAYVTAISGVTLTVLRAQEGTGAQNWNVGDFAFCAPTAGTIATGFGNPNNVFQVAPATLPTQAAQAVRMGTAGGLTLRNKLLNALGNINLRGYSSGTATTTANQYTIDQWKVITSGQNLSWTQSGNIKTFNAPAGGVSQIVSKNDIIGGVYTLSWTGTATATVNGTPVTSGGQVTIAGATQTTVTFTAGTFSFPQLELGTIATTFDDRNYGIELAQCMRFYQAPVVSSSITGYADVASRGLSTLTYVYPIPMEKAPAVGISNGSGINASIGSLNVLTTAFTQVASSVNAGYSAYTYNLAYLDGGL